MKEGDRVSIAEIFIISVGLSIDVLVAVVYLGAGFSKIEVKNLIGLCGLFGGVQVGSLVLGNLVTLLPLFSVTHSQRAADRW